MIGDLRELGDGLVERIEIVRPALFGPVRYRRQSIVLDEIVSSLRDTGTAWKTTPIRCHLKYDFAGILPPFHASADLSRDFGLWVPYEDALAGVSRDEARGIIQGWMETFVACYDRLIPEPKESP